MGQRQKFKVGDRVRVVDAGLFNGEKGQEGVVAVMSGHESMPFEVEFDGWDDGHGGKDGLRGVHSRWFFSADEIEPLEPAHPFKVGDRVRYKDSGAIAGTVGSLSSPYAFGSEHTVTYAGEEGFDYVSSLELVIPTTPTFKVGDRVQANGFATDNDAGTIVQENNGEFFVAWDSALSVTWSADELYLIPKVPPLKPGVRVRITGGIAAGEEGVVIGIRGKQVNVRTDEHYMDNAGQLMRHVSASTAIVIPLQEAA